MFVRSTISDCQSASADASGIEPCKAEELIVPITKYIKERMRIEEQIAERRPKIEESLLKAQEAGRKAQEADQKAQEADRKAQEAHQKAQEADQKAQEARQKAREAIQGQNTVLVRVFLKIFCITDPVPNEQIDPLYSTYLSDKSISFDKSNSCFRLNSMAGVVKYLKEHPEVKQCDFRAFKAKVDNVSTLDDLSTFVNYLATGEAKVKAIAISSGISQEAKQSLDIAAKKGRVQVQYFS